MNAKQRTLLRGAMIRRWAIPCFITAITTVMLSAADELVRIDFRNKIPGVVDAPVFDIDGISRLEGTRFTATLFAGPATNSLLSLMNGTEAFLTGADAGYWRYDTPLAAVPWFLPAMGQETYYELAIYEWLNRGPFPEPILVGRSRLYSMVITNTVMPMVGLESFKLEPERLEIRAQGDQAIIQWLYLAASRYELQRTTSLQPPILWTPIFEWSFDWADLDERGHLFSVSNSVTALPQFYRLERWRQTWE
jgi:hypothetical protein